MRDQFQSEVGRLIAGCMAANTINDHEYAAGLVKIYAVFVGAPLQAGVAGHRRPNCSRRFHRFHRLLQFAAAKMTTNPRKTAPKTMCSSGGTNYFLTSNPRVKTSPTR